MLKALLTTPGVREVHLPGGPVGMMALHGGLEEGTFEIAAQVARETGASLYAVVQPDDLRWHVPSIRYDPVQSRALRRFLRSTRLAVSVHGFGRAQLRATAYVGGRNVRSASLVAAELGRCRGVTAVADHEAIPKQLRGIHLRNPVNLPALGGVQLELTPDLRRLPMRAPLSRALVAAVRSLANIEELAAPKT